MPTEQKTERFQDGDVADIECCSPHGVNVHTYYGKSGAWLGRCGFVYPTEEFVVPHRLKAPVHAEPWRPPIQPSGVRIRRSDGTSETLPLGGYFEVVVRKVGSTTIEGVEHPLVRGSAHEFASITFTYPKESK